MNIPSFNNLPIFNNLPFLDKSNTPYWIKVTTNKPKCTYYFGPFDSVKEAKLHKDGYIEDLAEEKALGISVETKQCKPEFLTFCEEE